MSFNLFLSLMYSFHLMFMYRFVSVWNYCRPTRRHSDDNAVSFNLSMICISAWQSTTWCPLHEVSLMYSAWQSTTWCPLHEVRLLIWCCIVRCFQVLLTVLQTGKARRLKQAKEEAQQEIEAYRKDCEKQYREHEAKVVLHHFSRLETR